MMRAEWCSIAGGCRFMTETPSPNEDSVADAPPEPERKVPRQHSIVPRSSVAVSALMLVVAIMTFLASLTLAAVTVVNDTARGWQRDIAREVTVQVRPVDGTELEDAVLKARQLLGATPGVLGVTVLGSDVSEKLLEPWLGSGLDLSELPVPKLISVTLDESNPPDLVALKSAIADQVDGASLDDHRAWIDRLTLMARAIIVSGALVLMLVLSATVLTVVFATRGAMAGNKHVIEVLHFVGANPSYIANEFQRHFLLVGLKGALTGGGLAVLSFLAAGWWAARNIANPGGDQFSALFGTFSVGPWGYVATFLLVVVVALLTAVTSRQTVLRHVGTLDRSGKPVTENE